MDFPEDGEQYPQAASNSRGGHWCMVSLFLSPCGHNVMEEARADGLLNLEVVTMLGSTGCFPNSSLSSQVNSGGAARLYHNKLNRVVRNLFRMHTRQ